MLKVWTLPQRSTLLPPAWQKRTSQIWRPLTGMPTGCPTGMLSWKLWVWHAGFLSHLKRVAHSMKVTFVYCRSQEEIGEVGGGSLAPEFRCSTKPRCWEVGNACWGLYKLRSNCQPGAFLLAMQMQLSRFVKPYEALIDEIRGLLPPATGIQMACSRECASVS